MLNLINNAKRVAETISIVVSFSDLLPSSETISGTPLIIVSPYTGTDPSPSNILYQLPIVNGAVVDQKFRLGISGVVYEILYSITTNVGTTYEKSVYLAILPEAGEAIPSFLPFWETTDLYPYYPVPEGIIPSAVISAGNLQLGLVTYSLWEGIYPSVVISAGSMTFYGTVSYTMVPEGIIPNAVINAGILTLYTTLSYALTEGIIPNAVITAGSFTQGLVTYNMQVEGIVPNVVITAGNLA